MNTSVIVSRKVVNEVSCPSVSYPAVSCDAIKMSTSNKMTTSRDEIFTAEVDHLIQRSFGDEVLMRTIERKCLFVKQLYSMSPVLKMNVVRHTSMPEAGYIANPMLVRLIWNQTIAIAKQPFHADVSAEVFRAPSIELKPSQY